MTADMTGADVKERAAAQADQVSAEKHRHKNIPVFIPHLGCPNDCVFCNQRTISGRQFFDEASVEGQIREAVSTLLPGDTAEIAFFGGSFTGIDRGLMIRLLSTARGFLSDPSCPVSSVRCSTRPDYIDGEILSILKEYGVGTVELGIQSMSDSVLEASKRGHTAADTGRACAMIVGSGLRLGGQMMVGLPGSSPSDERDTALAICRMGACEARIYPTVVFRGTRLCEMTASGEYSPLTLEDAVARSADLLEIFDSHGVRVIRTGLCAGESLAAPGEIAAGVYHPATGELAMAEVFRRRMEEAVCREGLVGLPHVTFEVPAGAASRAAGQHRSNIRYLSEKYRIGRIKILKKSSLIGYNIIIHNY